MDNATNFEKVLGKKNANIGEAIVNVKEKLNNINQSLIINGSPSKVVKEQINKIYKELEEK